jgi:[3-methyl-2-oxobutanoate dehydrogenase (acetyl-transferring)] kinase
MELYIRSFKIITSFKGGKEIETIEEARDFADLLEDLLNQHNTVISDLSTGFRESHVHMVNFCGGDNDAANEYIAAFMNRNLTSRLGIRLLVKHHLALKEQMQDEHQAESSKIGIIDTRWRPADAIEEVARKIQLESMDTLSGHVNPPRVKLDGHTEACFPFIPTALEFILEEVFRNAFRAVIDSNINSARELPPIDVTIAVNRDDFTIRIADRGRGISQNDIDKIWRYHYTTRDIDKKTGTPIKPGEHHHRGGVGIGLPIAKAYAKYLKGDLEIKSLDGIGTDTYLKIMHIDPRSPGTSSFII